ncbi:MAG: PfkB family carbohydrate kinase, partial [Gaiella sp.]
MPRAAIIGNLVLDEVAGAPPRPGGAVFYCGRALRLLHAAADVVLVCRCAEQHRALLLPAVEELGFPVVWRAAERTTRFAFHYEGDRRIMQLHDNGDPWTPDDVDGWVADAIGDAEWVLVGALTRDDFPHATLAQLVDRGHRVVVDAQGLVRYGTLGPLRSDGLVDRAVLDDVTVLKLNDEEADLLAGGHEPEHLRALGIAEVVLTLGSQGAVVATEDGVTRIAAVPVEGPVDPTGAGDSFLVAYLLERLRGATPEAAGTSASAFVS